ncbi:hypothetical protein HMPREF9244_01477 [Alloscardovia omnicolens F0580]|uniref:tRNA nuclease CdiA C-terminal domain-containing protein n=1 Tax=Alloscardovia omnicolens F0580 TaxID=1321816 RepID=U1SD60_9BIFI|nr:hypothetical protein HMPREF9244_01477 [Alloscardovia omnicolens F0580]
MLWREVLFIFLHAISCVEVISELYYLLQERCYGTGIRVFLGDRVLVFNPATGVEEEKGLADLKNGVDIKTLTMAASRNTVDSYLRNTSKKLDATTVIFDNVDNHGASDDEIIQWIRRSQRFKRGKIYILSQGSALIRIR